MGRKRGGKGEGRSKKGVGGKRGMARRNRD